jgi:hypothetical protein
MSTSDGIYAKQCESLADYYSEIVGHTFWGQYYPYVPAIRARYERKRQIHYDNPAKNSHRMLGDMLNDDQYSKRDLVDAFQHLAYAHGRNAVLRNSTGGTTKLYLQQRKKLQSEQLQSYFSHFASRHESVTVNGVEIPVNPHMIANVRYNISALPMAVCVPSHGNLHERTLYSNGQMLHFEHAGWNALATEAATFIWHTLFVGNHFGPRYADWATEDDKHAERYNRPKAIIYDNGTLAVRINASRKHLMEDYLRFYLRKIGLSADLQGLISHAIAFRLLTAYDLEAMRASDRLALFSLASYFTYNPTQLEESLHNLMHPPKKHTKKRPSLTLHRSKYFAIIKHLF